MRKAEVYLYDRLAGLLVEDENGYTFQYNEDYLADNPKRLSVTFRLLEIAADNWKLDPNDRMGLLLACCRDCIGAASVREVKYAD